MIKFSNDNKMDVVWQLGNEPNAYQYIFNYTVSPSQLVKDFARLRRILNKYPVYKNKMLVGPDITNPAPEDSQSIAYLQGFLASDGGEVVSAITFHQYYFNGKLATQDDFLHPDNYNKLIAQIELVKGIVSLYKTKTKTVWLSK
ncbi:heparanase [Holotrichia oblita]|nr:heparanase [Holotrichia oblita]